MTLNQTYVFTATQTWHNFHSGDGTVFVDTGDIHQQWLRDSCNQMRVYLPLAGQSAAVEAVMVGSLRRMATFYNGDAYASAFNPLPRDAMGDSSLYDQCPKSLHCLNCTCEDCAPACSDYSYQHNFELDSFCWVVDLSHRLWQASNTTAHLDQPFLAALRRFVGQLQVEQDHGSQSPYRFRTDWTSQDYPDNHVNPSRPAAKCGG
jgi:meiotically up-regulated gene 157 (Mug157) protein